MKSNYVNLIESKLSYNVEEYLTKMNFKNISWSTTQLMFIRNCKRVYEVNELLHYLSENKNYVNLKSMLLKLCSVSKNKKKLYWIVNFL